MIKIGMINVGIDPGKDGGIAIIYPSGKIEAFATPKAADEIDISAIQKKFRVLGTLAKLGKVQCVLEDVHSIFGSSAVGNFQFGRALGIVEALLTANEIPFTKIAPKTWQKEMWTGIKVIGAFSGKTLKSGKEQFKVDNKGMSLMAAKRLYPHVNLLPTERCKKPHNGIVDALLLAGYCKRKM
jgi:hypothetical protein